MATGAVKKVTSPSPGLLQKLVILFILKESAFYFLRQKWKNCRDWTAQVWFGWPNMKKIFERNFRKHGRAKEKIRSSFSGAVKMRPINFTSVLKEEEVL